MERVALLSEAEQVTAAALRLPRAPRMPAALARTGESVNEQMASLERARIEEALARRGVESSPAPPRGSACRGTRLRYRMERHGLSDAATRRHVTVASLSLASTPHQRRSSPVRWQRTRVTLLQAQLLDGPVRRQPSTSGCECSKRSRAKASAFRRADHRAGARVGEGGVRSRPRRGRGAPRGPRGALLCSASSASDSQPLEVADRPSHRGDARRAARGSRRARRRRAAGRPARARRDAGRWRRVGRSSRPRRRSRSWSGDSTSSRSRPHRTPRQVWRVTGLADADRHATPVRVARPRNRAARGSADAGRRRTRPGGAPGRRPGHRQDAPAARVPSTDQRIARPGCRDRPCPLAARCRFIR